VVEVEQQLLEVILQVHQVTMLELEEQVHQIQSQELTQHTLAVEVVVMILELVEVVDQEELVVVEMGN
tara:strand:- start:143 stop:346 length:204 start_codon:yes stop_codon:yes gene_type:complete